MIEGRCIVRDYDGLLEALRARALEIGATRKAIDEISGLPDGYSGTLLAPQPIRSLGKTSLGPVLGSLGLALIVIEDEEAWAKVKDRVGNGHKSFMRNGALNRPIVFKLSLRHMRKMGRIGGKARWKGVPLWKRRSLARRAARARWRKVKQEHTV